MSRDFQQWDQGPTHCAPEPIARVYRNRDKRRARFKMILIAAFVIACVIWTVYKAIFP